MKVFFKWAFLIFIWVGFFYMSVNADQTNEKQQSGQSLGVETEVATFAAGCFWCLQPPFDKKKGVLKTITGFSGGHLQNPTYKQVSKGDTGHREVIRIVYNPSQISYEDLLKIFWRNVDAFDATGQFCDRGFTYSPAIFYHDEAQKEMAEKSLKQVATELSEVSEDKSSEDILNSIVVPVVAFENFYAADESHQDYYKRNPFRYKYYRYSCGRDKRLAEIWGKVKEDGSEKAEDDLAR